MTEKQWKSLVKNIIDSGYQNIDKNEKEIYKSAIDKATTFEQLSAIITELIIVSRNKG